MRPGIEHPNPKIAEYWIPCTSRATTTVRGFGMDGSQITRFIVGAMTCSRLSIKETMLQWTRSTVADFYSRLARYSTHTELERTDCDSDLTTVVFTPLRQGAASTLP